jgi:hypothetical protein
MGKFKEPFFTSWERSAASTTATKPDGFAPVVSEGVLLNYNLAGEIAVFRDVKCRRDKMSRR